MFNARRNCVNDMLYDVRKTEDCLFLSATLLSLKTAATITLWIIGLRKGKDTSHHEFD
jgi:hypothetical protein